MNTFWTGLFLFVTIFVIKILFPKESYALKTTLWLLIIGGVIFGIRQYKSIEAENYDFSSLIACLACFILVGNGGRDISLKTTVNVFSNITNKVVGQMHAGSMNWSDPIFEKVYGNIDDEHNHSSLDLQALEIEINEISEMQTSEGGIKVKFKVISFMLSLIPHRIEEIYEIEGGLETIRRRIRKHISEFFFKETKKYSPEFFYKEKTGDTDPIEFFSEKLKEEINLFCIQNHYPYMIDKHSDVTIGGIELDAKYYEALAQKTYTVLRADAEDETAKRLRERILETGKKLLPSGTNEEQLEAALISLGITKKDIQEKKFGVSNSEDAKLIAEMIKTLKNNL